MRKRSLPALAISALVASCGSAPGEDSNPVLKVTPTDLDFGTTQNGPLNFIVSNTGTGRMDYEITRQDDWLSIDGLQTPQFSVHGATGEKSYAVKIDRSKLGPNQSVSRILVKLQNGPLQMVSVRATSDKCAAGAKRCADAFTIAFCGGDGTWQAPQDCGNGKYCDGPASECRAQQCKPSEYKCFSEKSSQQCSADGSTWQDPVSCPVGQVCLLATGSCGTDITPTITGIDGDGSRNAVVDYRKAVPTSAANTFAGYRFQKALVISGSNLTKVDDTKNRLDCTTNPNVFFTSKEGLVFETGGTDMKRNLFLPSALGKSACILFTLTVANLGGKANAQVYVLQGEPGLTSLMDIQLEPVGANCANGGQKILSGLDTNGDGTLAATEVKTTKYLCNGVSGKDGTNGKDGKDGQPGPKGEPGAVTGTIMPFFGNSAPTGWLLADGSSINKALNPEYTNLVDQLRAMGPKYQGATVSDAILPDLRGIFLRGRNGTRADTYKNPNGDEVVGTFELDSYTSHDHGGSTGNVGNHHHRGSSVLTDGSSHYHGFGGYIDACNGCTDAAAGPASGHVWPNKSYTTDTDGAHAHGLSVADDGAHTHDITASGGTETRPRNMTVLYVIKY